MPQLSISQLDTPFIFRARPESLPGDLRPLWRVAVLLLILQLACRGARASFGQLHVLNWALKSVDNRIQIEQVINGEKPVAATFVRIEPSLNRAVDLAHGEGLVERVHPGRIQLTQKGRKAAQMVLEAEYLMTTEKAFLRQIGKRLTLQAVRNLLADNAT